MAIWGVRAVNSSSSLRKRQALQMPVKYAGQQISRHALKRDDDDDDDDGDNEEDDDGDDGEDGDDFEKRHVAPDDSDDDDNDEEDGTDTVAVPVLAQDPLLQALRKRKAEALAESVQRRYAPKCFC